MMEQRLRAPAARRKGMACDISKLSGIPYFELLDEEDRKDIAGTIDVVNLAQGEPLFQAGDPGDSLFIVRTGEVELYVRDNVGQKIVLTTAQEGDHFGELALLDAGPRTATAVALTECELLVMDRDDLLFLFKKKPDAALHLLAAMGTMTRKADELLRRRVTRNPNEEEEERLTVGQRLADVVAAFGGSWTFILIFGTTMAIWMGGNSYLRGSAFDPFPFILLNLGLSALAALQAPVIMMSQNRQAGKDRLKSDLEYEVNLKAELEVAHLHEKVDQIYEKMLDRFAKLEKMTAKEGGPGSPA